jgi:nucleoside-diphosphate-sugar epimerase
MVIGNGLLAKKMSSFNGDNNILIFASGVSNSKETNHNEYKRELDLLKTFLGTEKKLIYFSTCSVLMDCQSISDYIEHKKNIEGYIRNNFSNYLIFRLPNVVGNTDNIHTSFNYFKNKLISNSQLFIEKESSRYFIDVDDLTITLTPIILDIDQNKKEINVCFNNKTDIFNFVMSMSEILNVTPKINLIDGGCSQDVDNTEFIEIVNPEFKNLGNSYNIKMIKKYC